MSIDATRRAFAALLLNVPPSSTRKLGDLYGTLLANGYTEPDLEAAVYSLTEAGVISVREHQKIVTPRRSVLDDFPEGVFHTPGIPRPEPQVYRWRVVSPSPTLKDWWKAQPSTADAEGTLGGQAFCNPPGSSEGHPPPPAGPGRNSALADDTDRRQDVTEPQEAPQVPVNHRVGEPGARDSASAVSLWARAPIEAFERLRDRVCEAIQLVRNIHRQAAVAPATSSLADAGEGLQGPLEEAVRAAQDIWFDTPVSRYLDRAQGPVYLDHLEQRPTRVSGSCWHDLALAVAVGALDAMQAGEPASRYVAKLRDLTAAGDQVSQRLASLVSQVRCESREGAERWEARADAGQTPSAGRGEAVVRASTPKRRGPKLKYDPRADARIADAWATDRHRTFGDLARELGGGLKPLDVRKAIDRHQARQRSKE
jgi:hypothetical protein